jgi:3-dehydroquinate synthase
VIRTVEVDLGERSYPVQIGVGTLPLVGEAVQKSCDGPERAVVVTVPEVGRRYAGKLVRSLRAAGMRSHRIDVPDGDATKNLRQMASLYEELLDIGADRRTVLVALGGGMVGDLTGFTAATFLRGIPFVQIPTTVLAMVDASVGGKTGVNLRRGKNLVGAFHQPKLVSIDVETLASLPMRERAAGFAEVIKVAAIWDADLFERLETDAEALMDLELDALVRVIDRAVGIKAEVVSQDEREHGVRMLLNFGHTIAHALETLLRYRRLLHGEAVAIGMIYAARRSEALGLAASGTAERLEALCARFGLPTELHPFERSAYLSALRVDKKRQNARIHYVILEDIGRASTVALTPSEIVAAVPRGRPKGRASRRPRR